MPEISIIIPVYNEPYSKLKNICYVEKYFLSKNIRPEIIIVDDGSTKNIGDLADIAIKNPHFKIINLKENRGKGYVCKIGIERSTKPLILMTDTDLSTPIEEFEKLYEHINEYDIVIGSRYRSPDIVQPWQRKIVSVCAHIVIGLLLLPKIKDTQCGFKLFKRDSINQIIPYQTINRFGFDAEILYIAKLQNQKVKEVPVKWVHGPGSTVYLWKDSTKTFFEILSIKFNSLTGRYK